MDIGDTEGAMEPDKKEFINETIVPKSGRASRLFKYLLKLAISGVIVGAIALAVMVAGWNRYEPTESSASSESTTESESESTVETTNTIAESIAESSAQAEQIESAIGSYDFSIANLEQMLGELMAVADSMDANIASIYSVKSELDWFNNTVETMDVYSGICIAKTDTQVLYLTTADAISEAEALRIVLDDGAEYDGTLVRSDGQAGLAVVALEINDDNRSRLETITAVKMATSYSVGRGDMVIAVGAPDGHIHSADFGFVTYVMDSTSVYDGEARGFRVDTQTDEAKGTWILDSSGMLVGWATTTEGEYVEGDVCFISDHKKLIEHMAAGQATSYLGIRFMQVPRQQIDEGMPQGLYIMEVASEGPAYTAGIQPGDIIVGIANTDVTTTSKYTTELEKLHAEDIVKVSVKRYGKDEYVDLDFQVTVGAR